MILSFQKACAGAHVEHLTSVVDFWRTVEPRHLAAHNMTAFYAFRMVMNKDRRVVLQTKEFMHHDGWSPDPNFAPAMLRDISVIASIPAFANVVPNVLDTAVLSRIIEGNQARLALPRSTQRFPREGSALAWWRGYLAGECARVQRACEDCVRIRTKLSKIVISQLNKNATAEQKAAKNTKTQERHLLETELSEHTCADRASGRLSVAITPGSILHRLTTSLTEPSNHRAQPAEVYTCSSCGIWRVDIDSPTHYTCCMSLLSLF